MKPIDGDSVRDEILYGEAYVSAELEVYIKRVFDDAPTLDYKDLVPQGEWVVPVTGEPWRGGYFGKCSNCKEIYHNTEMMPPYCPRCGARMKGGGI